LTEFSPGSAHITVVSEITGNQVLAQAGISMLSQVNAMPQMAMSLLNGWQQHSNIA